MERYKIKLEESNNAFLVPHRSFCEKVLDLEPGARAIVSNGKVRQQLYTYLHSQILPAIHVEIKMTICDTFQEKKGSLCENV